MIVSVKKHYVTFSSPGTFVSEETRKEIESWDTALAVKMSKKISERYEAKPYGFQFETYLEVPPISDGMNFFDVKPKHIETSGTYFLGGELKTYEQALKEAKDEDSILLSNMRGNEYWIVCVNTNSFKSTMPFGEKDFVVGANGEILESGNSELWKKYRAECKEKYGYKYE